MIPGLTLNYDATTGTIAPRRIVKFGPADKSVVQSSVPGEGGIGVSDSLGDVPGGRADIYRAGLVDVLYGGTITRGARLTNDAQGRAVTAATGNAVVGIAEVSGVVGDIGKMLIVLGNPPAP